MTLYILHSRTVCGRRCRVELSTGRTRSRGYSGPSRRGRPFHPEDRCYECGSRGHYARDCPLYSRGRRRYNKLCSLSKLVYLAVAKANIMVSQKSRLMVGLFRLLKSCNENKMDFNFE